jgi:hypothetical protein
VARRNGVPRDDVTALLAHTKSDVTRVYDVYDMLDEKRAAVSALGKAVSRIASKRQN